MAQVHSIDASKHHKEGNHKLAADSHLLASVQHKQAHKHFKAAGNKSSADAALKAANAHSVDDLKAQARHVGSKLYGHGKSAAKAGAKAAAAAAKASKAAKANLDTAKERLNLMGRIAQAGVKAGAQAAKRTTEAGKTMAKGVARTVTRTEANGLQVEVSFH